MPPAPKNVGLTRMSQTSLKVTWDPPDFPDITGYRIYYNMYVQRDLDKWESAELGEPFCVFKCIILKLYMNFPVEPRNNYGM